MDHTQAVFLGHFIPMAMVFWFWCWYQSEKSKKRKCSMSKVTAELLMAIVSLSKNHEIDFVSINSDHRSDQIHISISTSLDSRIEIVEDKLLTVFPTVVYTGDPYITKDRSEGVLTILQEINVGVENVHVTLHTHTTREKEKPSASTESIREISHPDCIINVTKDESSLEPWHLEKV